MAGSAYPERRVPSSQETRPARYDDDVDVPVEVEVERVTVHAQALTGATLAFTNAESVQLTAD